MEVFEILDPHSLQHKYCDMPICRVDFQNCCLLHIVAEHSVIIRQPDFSILCDHLPLS